MITNIPAPDHLDELLYHLQCFFKDQRKKDRSDFEPDTMSSFQKTPASHWLVNTYSALSFDRITFSTWRICFHFLGKTLLNALVFVSQ